MLTVGFLNRKTKGNTLSFSVRAMRHSENIENGHWGSDAKKRLL